MKKALFIAYGYPPLGGPGVQRTSKFVKYIGEYGWDPVVLTRSDKNVPLRDESLMSDIPEGLKIIRTAPWDLTVFKGLPGKAFKLFSWKLLVPDIHRLWQVFSQKTAEKILTDEKINVIYTTSMPYSAHLMGLALKKKYPDVAWVADFRDEWTNNPYTLDKPHNFIRTGMERRMEQKVLKYADALITNTPVMLENFLKNNPHLPLTDKFFAIPNGYDVDDFDNIAIPARESSKFTITYTGSFYGRRKPDIFLEALSRLISDGRLDRSKVIVKLIGSFKQQQVNELVRRYGLEGIIEMHGYMAHDECVGHMLASDCLLLIEGGGPGAEAFYTGKIFEYMVTNRPILAVIPEKGAAARLIRETRTGLISDCSDSKGTEGNIFKLYNAWASKQSIYDPDLEQVARFDRKKLTGELVEVFEYSLKNKKRV